MKIFSRSGYSFVIIIFLFMFLSAENIRAADKYKKYPIWSQKRLDLTKDYVKKHYGLENVNITGPYLVVIHYTATSTIQETLRLFKPAVLNSSRKNIIKGGRLNVGVHFVIDTNGDIWSLLPPDIIGRHTIGFNHVSIGIELVALNSDKITGLQLKSCVKLIAELYRENDSIKYLIGHHEYMRKELPHFSLLRELDKTYKFTKKSDPGKVFMNRLRTGLKQNYNIVLQP